MTLVLGIDDAGRGPLIGPMILAGVLMEKYKDGIFRDHGIKDSKLLSHKQRLELQKTIKEHSVDSFIVKSMPDEIDSAVHSTNLNTLEAMKTAEIINNINQGKYQKEKIKVIVDCPSVNIKKWQETLKTFIEHKDNLDISCEHKADFNHPVVSAASILAKCMREEEVDKLKKEYSKYGNIGSGYPSDPSTKEFLKKHGKTLGDSGIFRKSWATWKALFPEQKKQSTLEGF
jgi:ribonuclease HII